MLILCVKKTDNPNFESDDYKQLILNYYCGVDNYIESMKRNEYGKPYVENVPFSVAHSGDVICMAVYSDKLTPCTEEVSVLPIEDVDVKDSIGIDLEAVYNKNYEGCERISRRRFFESERAVLEKCESESEFIEEFCKMWTMKESYCKFFGKSLTDALKFDTQAQHDDICIRSEIMTFGKRKYAFSICYTVD